MSIRRASAGQVKELALGVGAGVPADISEADASRNLADMSQIHLWLQLGLTMDLSQVDVAAVKVVIPKILEQVTTVTVPAIPPFDVATHFQVTPRSERKDAEVLIGYIGDNIQKLIQDQTEPEIEESILRVHKLLRASVDVLIIAELGGEQAITTTWGQMYEMMRQQGHGQEGDLLVDGCANIFYIAGTDWAAFCYWRSGSADWRVYAAPVTYPFAWRAGFQVFSR